MDSLVRFDFLFSTMKTSLLSLRLLSLGVVACAALSLRVLAAEAAPASGQPASAQATAAAPSCCTPAPSCCAAAPADESGAPALSAASLYQLDGVFENDRAQEVRLASLRGRPVLLALFFSSCTYACPMIVSDLTRIRAALPAPLRDELAIVLVSFDVARDTPEQLARFRGERGLDDAWTLLHGSDATVAELAALVGVKYRREADGQFAHSNLITVLNREGEVVHQRAGLEGGLDDAAAAVRRLEVAR
jgi:protein SCO1/2